jgi:hypothetical protein
MSGVYESQVDGLVHLADHALEKMIERNISHPELADALARPDQTYPQGTRRIYQYRDFAAVVETRTNDVLTVLFRVQGQWTSDQGQPSGRVLSKNTRRRMEAELRCRLAARQPVPVLAAA